MRREDLALQRRLQESLRFCSVTKQRSSLGQSTMLMVVGYIDAEKLWGIAAKRKKIVAESNLPRLKLTIESFHCILTIVFAHFFT